MSTFRSNLKSGWKAWVIFFPITYRNNFTSWLHIWLRTKSGLILILNSLGSTKTTISSTFLTSKIHFSTPFKILQLSNKNIIAKFTSVLNLFILIKIKYITIHSFRHSVLLKLNRVNSTHRLSVRYPGPLIGRCHSDLLMRIFSWKLKLKLLIMRCQKIRKS